jgi:NitT/TauT family transport system ATP-binding protein
MSQMEPAGDAAAAAVPPKVALRQVAKSVPTPEGGRYEALGDVSFDVPAGQFVSIVGPSGCGKSTLLRRVAGLAAPDGGVVLLDGRPVAGIDRRLGFIFQQDALLPWRTVYDNVALGLRIRGLPQNVVRQRVEEWIGRVGLHGFERTTRRAYPAACASARRSRRRSATSPT